MTFWTYMLRCSDNRYYTGHTEDLGVRLAQHQQGYFRTCWTYKRRPVEPVWCEAFTTRDEALTAERMVGGWSRANKEALIRGDWAEVSYFARPPHERFSTSLETNGVKPDAPAPLTSSELEKRGLGQGSQGQ
jgi:predicted GIY-YIG superfamily endonuclease